MKKINKTFFNETTYYHKQLLYIYNKYNENSKEVHQSPYHFQINGHISLEKCNHTFINAEQEEQQELITTETFGVTVKEVFPICLR